MIMYDYTMKQKKVDMLSRSELIRMAADDIKLCNLCSARLDAACPVPGKGNCEARVVILGRNPGAQENKLIEPFVGPAGKKLDEFLNIIELSRQDVYITNLVKCYTKNNREPQYDEIKTCRFLLDLEISIIRPSLIIGLGEEACDSMVYCSSSSSRQKFFIVENKDIEIEYLFTPTRHPSAALRNGRFNNEFLDDARWIKSFLNEANNNIPHHDLLTNILT